MGRAAKGDLADHLGALRQPRELGALLHASGADGLQCYDLMLIRIGGNAAAVGCNNPRIGRLEYRPIGFCRLAHRMPSSFSRTSILSIAVQSASRYSPQ
jgi:hypothetical protein